jgi:DNA-binding transcriptional LysR family regulator
VRRSKARVREDPFAQANPQIRIELEELNSDQVAMAVADGRADCGILVGGTPVLGLQNDAVPARSMVLVVPERHPLTGHLTLTLGDAIEYGFVSLSQSTSLAGLLDVAATSLEKRLKVRIRVRSFDAMCMMVAANLGIALLPAAAVRPHLPSVGLREKLPRRYRWKR